MPGQSFLQFSGRLVLYKWLLLKANQCLEEYDVEKVKVKFAPSPPDYDYVQSSNSGGFEIHTATPDNTEAVTRVVSGISWSKFFYRAGTCVLVRSNAL